MKIGYIRVTKQEQNEALQRDALKEAGSEKYFNDKMTGAKFEQHTLMEVRSSPRIRSAPQSRFFVAISLINVMVSAATLGL